MFNLFGNWLSIKISGYFVRIMLQHCIFGRIICMEGGRWMNLMIIPDISIPFPVAQAEAFLKWSSCPISYFPMHSGNKFLLEILSHVS